MKYTTKLNTPCTLQLPEKKRNSFKGSFETTIIEAVDEGLSSLGNPCKQAIYFQLEKAFNIKKQEIPLKIEEFANAIEQIFGVGAKIIEMRIIAVLHEEFQDFTYFPEEEDLVFTEYMARLRNFL